MPPKFDFENSLFELRSGKDLTGKDGVLMSLIMQLTEATITAELENRIASGMATMLMLIAGYPNHSK